MSLLLALILSFHTALADTATTSSGLASTLRSMASQVGQPILVGAAGSDAEKAVSRLQRADASLRLQVVRVPTVGDAAAEMARALTAANLRCGVRVATLPTGGLSKATYGDCRSIQEVADAALEQAAQASASLDVSDASTSPLPPVPSLQQPSGELGQAVAAPAPVTAPVPVAAPVSLTAPQPAPAINPAAALPTLQRADLFQAASAWAKAPDPTVALLESMFVGFGAGHFYSGNAKAGTTHLGIQAGGLLASAVGVGLTAFVNDAAIPGAILSGAGSLTFTVGRIVDVYTAPMSAHAERQRLFGGL